ncbi:MAG: AraC family transcriptional regulator, partial [Ruminococcaceae bacterium]|nr:AraC family transcriptional regulator [Oscillospiraceae bacterium]
TLDILAEQLHLSKYYISHVFTERLNLSFPDFINGLRVESACRRLDRGYSVTDAAFEAGFNSIRSFNRNFERVKGVAPSEYKKQVRNAAKPPETQQDDEPEEKAEKTVDKRGKMGYDTP